MRVVDEQYAEPDGQALPPLATPQQVEAITGGAVTADDPRTPLLIEGASTAIRRLARWHIAPVIEQTIAVSVPYGGVRLDVLLPSGKVRNVLAVRVNGRLVEQPAFTEDGHVWAGYLPDTAHDGQPRVHRIEADVHHGYRGDEVGDLVAVVGQVVAIAQSSPQGATREQAGALSVSWATTAPGVSGGLTLLERDQKIVDAYTLGSLP